MSKRSMVKQPDRNRNVCLGLSNNRQFVWRGLFAIVVWLGIAELAEAQTAKAEWTFLLYIAADNNLEAAQMMDLQEMLLVGSSDDVQIIALVDRSEKDDEAEGYTKMPVANLKDWTSAKLLHVHRESLTELADWGEVNMGDPANLKRFLETTMAKFPAKKYALIFGDHGAGWPGVCGDESHDNDMLTMTEIHDTLKSLPPASSRFELIGFDACLMATLECAFAIAPFAKVMVASEELEPGNGWHYTPLFQRIVAEPTMTGSAVGKVIVETFDDFYRNSPIQGISRAGLGITLSAIDLTKLDGVLKSLQSLAKACQADLNQQGRDSWLSLADARTRAEEYGNNNTTGTGGSLVDLGHLIKLIRTKFTEGPVDVAALKFEKSLKACVIANRHGKGRAHAHGLSIFFPAVHQQSNGEESGDNSRSSRDSKGATGQLDAYANTLFAKSNPWLGFIADFTTAAATDTEDPLLGEITASATEIEPGETATFHSELVADDLESAKFVLARRIDDVRLIIGELPATRDEDGNLHDEWDGKWFTLKVGDHEIICPITEFEQVEPEDDDENKAAADDHKGTEYFIEVPVQLKRQNKETWTDVSLYFLVDLSEDDITGEFVYAFKETKQGPTEVSLKVGDQIRPVFIVVNHEGHEQQVVSAKAEEILELEDPDDLSVAMTFVPPGQYEVGFQVYDFSENYAEQYVEVQVNE